jgi:putative heme-binding domain-containing protein
VQFVEVLGQINAPQCVPVLLDIVKRSNSNELRIASLGALQPYGDDTIGAAVVAFYNALPADVQSVAQSLLASRRSWAERFLREVEAGKIDPTSVPQAMLRKILFHDDERIHTMIRRQWGDVQGATTQAMRERIEHLQSVIGGAAGNPYDGKRLYMANCGKCHRLFDEGGDVGPNLTTYQRDDLSRMLINVVNPSAEIREGFENFLIMTQDGRMLTGFLADQDKQVVILRDVDGQNAVIPRGEIEMMRSVPQSVMPDGALDKLNDQEVRDLFAYLRATQPLNN